MYNLQGRLNDDSSCGVDFVFGDDFLDVFIVRDDVRVFQLTSFEALMIADAINNFDKGDFEL